MLFVRKYDPLIHHRRSIRLRGYDYSRAGRYFITICCQGHVCRFGAIEKGKMMLNDAGKMIEKWHLQLPNKFHDIKLGPFVVMPNHFHSIIIITDSPNVRADLCVRPDNLLSEIVRHDNLHPVSWGEHGIDDPGGHGIDDPGEHGIDDPGGHGIDDPGGHGIDDPGEHGIDDPGGHGIDDPGEHGIDDPGGHGIDDPGGHGIDDPGGHVGPPLPRVVQWFKTMTTNEYIRGVNTLGWKRFDGKLWQRNYYEHIIRDEKSYNTISNYIIDNPAKWMDDKFHNQ